jgi:phage terminase small subunit
MRISHSLTPRKIAFARHLADTGRKSAAAISAGYSDTGRAASVRAAELLRQPWVRAMVDAFLDKRRATLCADLYQRNFGMEPREFHT